MENLQEPIRLSVKAMEPSILSMAIRKAKLLEGFSYIRGMITKHPSTGIATISTSKELMRGKLPLQTQKLTNMLDYASCEELRKLKLYYTCRNPWEKGHRCNGKSQNIYLEVCEVKEDFNDEMNTC